jgi:hypothetical protein
MRREVLDARILGAFRFVDATTALPVRGPLHVTGTNVRFHRNRHDTYVITDRPGFEAYSASFPRPAAVPAATSVAFEVADPRRAYLPRRFQFALPRDTDPDHAANADAIFRAANVRLFASPIAPVGPGWAVVWATVIAGPPAPANTPAPWALIRVLRASDNVQLALGMADWRGEALVGVPGIPVTTWDSSPGGSVVTLEIDVTLRAVYDPAAVGVPDPDDLEARSAALPRTDVNVRLASGRALTIPIQVPSA